MACAVCGSRDIERDELIMVTYPFDNRAIAYFEGKNKRSRLISHSFIVYIIIGSYLSK